MISCCLFSIFKRIQLDPYQFLQEIKELSSIRLYLSTNKSQNMSLYVSIPDITSRLAINFFNIKHTQNANADWSLLLLRKSSKPTVTNERRRMTKSLTKLRRRPTTTRRWRRRGGPQKKVRRHNDGTNPQKKRAVIKRARKPCPPESNNKNKNNTHAKSTSKTEAPPPMWRRVASPAIPSRIVQVCVWVDSVFLGKIGS